MFKALDTKKVSEFFMIRKGWFSPEYELTDNVYTYGKITYHRLSMHKATVVTATDTWMFKREGVFSRTLLITDQDSVTVGRATQELFSRRIVFTLQTGFSAEFYRPSIWSREYIWESGDYGKIMHIHSSFFSLKDTIYIDQSMVPVTLIPLLTFLGSYLIILRRRRKAAH
ncbi:hypothetical protein [Mucilaginibacter sp.]|uniref:hypothetical protein n=1 Tax=Mucilaginibacter sp. TaxID=1882438 RepID=UPI002636F81E|nr:hypothetical protein [Mucilaginibacter sp.]MDB4919077.1 hypothetical protein [Mucilaginibacter sp.]